MPVNPTVIRRATPDELETDIDAFLAPLLTSRILGVEVDQSKISPFYTGNLYVAITADTDNAVVMAAPFRFKTFVSATEAEALILYANFLVANPTYFISPIFAVYRPEDPDPRQGVVLAAFYNTDKTGGQANWAATGGGFTNLIDIQSFTVSGVWTKPYWANLVVITVIGPGAGGGGGARGAAGSIRRGGGGGGSGGYIQRILPASVCGNTEIVTIGAPGVGGAAATVDTSAGGSGTGGGATSFGTLARMSGPGGGAGGGINAGGGGGGGASVGGGGGASSSTTGGVGGTGAANANYAAGSVGGGGGGGITSGNSVSAGGGTVDCVSTGTAGGIGGAAGGNPGISGVSAPAGFAIPAAGGGGGGANDAGPGGAGANGATYGGGGGGGGASLNGNNSGKGGDGGPGIIVVISR